MKFIFRDIAANSELVLPVTPESFEVSRGIRIETVNIHTLGDVALAGYGTLPNFKVDCLFPAHDYPFNQPEANTADPYSYVQRLKDWCDKRTVLRFIISDTMVNEPVLLEEIAYGERDGTGDVYATINMRKYRQLAAVRTEKTGNKARAAEVTSAPATDSYTVVSGDTLYAIARKFYGDASLCSALAVFNGIKNANLIYTGQIIRLPDKTLLTG